MEKIKNNSLFAASLLLVIAFCSSVAFAKAQDDKEIKDNGVDYRSSVATFVKGLLDIADKEQGGIG